MNWDKMRYIFLLGLSERMKQTHSPIFDKNVVNFIFEYATPSIPRVISKSFFPIEGQHVFGYKNFIFTYRFSDFRCYRRDGKLLFISHKFISHEFHRAIVSLTVSNDQIFVLNEGNEPIQVFDFRVVSDDIVLVTFNRKFGKLGKNNGELFMPNDLCIINDLLYVSDDGNSRVQVFDLYGRFVREWTVITGINRRMVVHPNQDVIFVSSNENIKAFSLDGRFLFQFRHEHYFEINNTLRSPIFKSISVLQDHYVCTYDAANESVHLYNLDGSFVCLYNHFEHEYHWPWSATCLDDTIYVLQSAKVLKMVALTLKPMYERRSAKR